MAIQDVGRLFLLQIPESDPGIIAPGGKPTAVGTEVQRIHRTLVPLQSHRMAALFRVPDLDDAIDAGRRHERAEVLRLEGKAAQSPRAGRNEAGFLARRRVPDCRAL